ncbi:Retrovirus-related Pol polyprotein from transposon opus [Gossypium australe]|uniref:Retrovirus-related Pol polyprotein from transposon opus n=1 Tax=Gossypium australe TaxID=47621 RepID=A0A5B6WS36_9ROSI|nr:Retrovirus-related Pol polyprotein from transposon opus [Gossypium australe]
MLRLKEMMIRSKKIKVEEQVTLNSSYSTREILYSLEIGSIHFNRALYDLGASISLMPLSIFEKLSLRDLKTTQITLQLANRSLIHPKGVLEYVLVKVRSFIIPTDFVVPGFEEHREIPILLERLLLATSRSTIDLERNELTMKINGESKNFKCGHQSSDEDKRKIGE